MEDGRRVITVVCTGNVCRSPMAERLLRHALQAEPDPLRSIQVRSAGVAAFPGDPASPNAIAALRKVGLDLSDHRSSPLTDQLVRVSDLILVMTGAHLDAIRRQWPDLAIPVHHFREWVPSGPREVPDPFGGSLDAYLDTRDSLAEAIPSILEYLRSRFAT